MEEEKRKYDHHREATQGEREREKERERPGYRLSP